MTTNQTMKVGDVVWREDLYPRITADNETIERYMQSLDVLPPIIVNQHGELIDGYHRWTAHRRMKAETIAATVETTASDAQLLRRAIETNATHGLQLSQADKRSMATKLYTEMIASGTKEADAKKDVQALLSVSKSAVTNWVQDIDKRNREKRNRTIADLWLKNYTASEIGEAVGLSKNAVNENRPENPELEKLVASTAARFEDEAWTDSEGKRRQLYNVWTFGKRDDQTTHFGNSDARIVENLVYAYTEPGGVVVDPFAGGASTLDVCRKRGRRCHISDRAVKAGLENDVREHDLTDGLPSVHNWKDVQLVYLDPPYWRQAAGEYSDDPTDLANMPLDEFNNVLAGLIQGFAKKLKASASDRPAHIALIIQPTQWRADDRKFVDHTAEMIRRVKLPIVQRIQAPYSSQQYNAQMVDWAKEHREFLVLSREVTVWRCD